MNRYWPILLILLPSGCLIAALVRWRRRCVANEKPLIIPAPRQLFTGHDEAMEARARARREIADSIRQRSALVASGSTAGSVLKIAKKA